MTETSTSAQPLVLTDVDTASISSTSTGSPSGMPGPARRQVSGASTDALPQALASNWTKLKSARLSQKFYGRLLALASNRTAPSFDPRNLRAHSLSQFLDFWEDIRDDAVEPEISISRDGSLVAEWFKSDKQRLDIKFADKLLMFGLFDRGSILEGAQDADHVSKILLDLSSKPLKWRA